MRGPARSFAFLRAVNVGGRRVKMADLAAALAGAGLAVTGTHLASGNVVFDDEDPDPALIEGAIEAAFGFTAQAFVRSAGDLRSILDRCPWRFDEQLVEVSFLQRAPDPDAIRRLEASVVAPEGLLVSGREVFFLREGKGIGPVHREATTQAELGMLTTRRGMATVAGLVDRYLDPS
jgi:uncharacterized protein (DUF1697 family)